MANRDPFIGQHIEKCRVLSLLSRGGYGTTYLAFDEELQSHRVIKVSHETLVDDPLASHANKAFLEEGLILSRLKHPQIVTLRAQGEFQGRRYMILDFVEGPSLREALGRFQMARDADHLSRWQPFPPLVASAIIASTLEPLAYAHQAKVKLPGREVEGIAHRDIAPGNLILGRQGDENGKIVLIDFGTAKTDLSDMVTLNQSLIGTLPYMSKPRLQRAQTQEQAAKQMEFWGEYSETRNDVHALGVLYAQLLTGKLPFTGETAPEILVSILDAGNYQRLYQDIEKIFPQALPFIQKMVVWYDVNQPFKDQAEQYASAIELRKFFLPFFRDISRGQSPEHFISELSRKLSVAEITQETMAIFEQEMAIPPPATSKTTSVIPSSTGSEGSDSAQPPTYPPSDGIHSSSLKIGESAGPTYDPRYANLGLSDAHPSRLKWLVGTLLFGLAALVSAWYVSQRSASREEKSTRLVSLEPLNSVDSNSSGDTPKVSPRKSKNKVPLKNAKTKRRGGLVTSDNSEENGDSSPIFDFETSFLAPDAKAPLHEGTQPPQNHEEFNALRNRVSSRDVSVLPYLDKMLSQQPRNADLRYLRAKWIIEQETPLTAHRAELAGFGDIQPQFLDPQVFQENMLFWTWQLNLKLFQSQPNESNRIAFIQAANHYLAAYSDLAQYASKVQKVRNSLPP